MRHERHPDPLQHMNDDHADDLLAAARVFAGHPDAMAARAERVDPRGIDLVVETPNGPTGARVDFPEPIPDATYPDGIRVAFVRLARQARAALSAPHGDPTCPRG